LEYLKDTLPKGWQYDAPHIKLLSEYLQKVDSGEITRLCISLPPRHGKTETITVRFSAYFFERNQKDNVLVTGYNERIARRFSRKARTIVKERQILQKDNAAQDEWSLMPGGTFMARGVGSPPTGVGFKLIVIDDPIKSREEAESETYRDKAFDWFSDDLYTRLEPGGRMVIVSTRWHEDDVISRAIASEEGKWVVLNLPALCDDPENDPLNRELDEPLWKERYSFDDFQRIKTVLVSNQGLYGWNSLYQGRPTGKEGSFFNLSNLLYDNQPPVKFKKLVRAWDLASSQGRGDYSVGVLAGIDDNDRMWVLDIIRGQYDSFRRDRCITEAANLDPKGTIVVIPQDPGQAGKSQKNHFARMLSGFKFISLPVTGSKETRAAPFASYVASGNVVFPKGVNWVSTALNELKGFPNGKHDDVIDALSDAYNFLYMKRTGGWLSV
jgi:predicted phage terminase large subunit-like protein